MEVLRGLLGNNREKTFKEIKNIKEGTKRFELKTFLQNTLGKGDLRAAVKLPEGEDRGRTMSFICFPKKKFLQNKLFFFCTKKNFPTKTKDEWLAMNTIDFYNQVNMIYGNVSQYCTQKSCTIMSAGPKYEWYWADGKNIKKPIGVSAPEYVDYLMEWIQSLFEGEPFFFF